MDQKKQLIKNFINAFLVGIVSVGLSTTNRIGIHIIYCLPIILFTTIFQNYLDRKLHYNQNLCGDKNCRYILKLVYIMITSIICLPLFLGFFFGIFHPLQSYQYEEINNCRIIGSSPINQSTFEQYNLLYVDFQYEGQTFLGASCISNLAETDSMYYYLYEDYPISCDKVGNSFDTPQNKQRVLNSIKPNNEYQQSKRILRVRGGCKKRGKFATSLYNFSKVKLPSWLCMQKGITYEEYTQLNRCYVHFMDGKNQSYENAKNRVNPKSVPYFAIVVYELPTFFPKAGFYCLIIFCLMPFLVNFYLIAGTITDGIYKIKFFKYKLLKDPYKI